MEKFPGLDIFYLKKLEMTFKKENGQKIFYELKQI